MQSTFALAAACAALLAGCAQNHAGRADTPKNTDHRTMQHGIHELSVITVLDDLHDAASKADGTRYFDHYAPDAIFLGTDATERWTKDQFVAYANPYFSKGKGWTYHPHDRHVTIAPDARTAWFDEQLSNDKYGECRGSGVLTRSGDPNAPDAGWKIVQYNLTVPVPNDLMPKVAEMIRNGK